MIRRALCTWTKHHHSLGTIRLGTSDPLGALAQLHSHWFELLCAAVAGRASLSTFALLETLSERGKIQVV